MESDTNPKYAIITICNDKFIDICKIMLFSFVENNKWFDGDIIVCCDKEFVTLSKKNRYILQCIYPKTKFREVNIDEYKDFINHFRGNVKDRHLPSAYTYEVFDCEGYDKVIYLDADMLVVSDIKPLFLLESEIAGVNWSNLFNFGLLAVTPCENTKIKQFLLKKGLELDPKGAFGFEETVFNRMYDTSKVEKLPNCYNYINVRTLNPEVKIVHYMMYKPWDSTQKFNRPNFITLWKDYSKKFRVQFKDSIYLEQTLIESIKKILTEVKDIVDKCETKKLTNTQWFLDFEDSLNQLSIKNHDKRNE